MVRLPRMARNIYYFCYFVGTVLLSGIVLLLGIVLLSGIVLSYFQLDQMIEGFSSIFHYSSE